MSFETPDLDTQTQVDSLFAEFGEQAPPVAIILSSDDDKVAMHAAEEKLDELGIGYETIIINPVRRPQLVMRYADSAALRGVRVIIASGGRSAILPAQLASATDLPVIGVPLAQTPLGGLESLLSMSQLPEGAAVGCMPIGGSVNAAIFASHILNALPLPPNSME